MAEYHIEGLRTMAADWLNGAEELHQHSRRKPCTVSRDYPAWNSFHNGLDQADTARGQALSVVCNMVEAEQAAVVAIEKSIRRYERHGGRFDRCIWGDTAKFEESYRRCVTIDPWAGFYKSTGRVKH